MTMLAGLSDAFRRLFAEREIYIRSDGSVRYVTLSTGAQIAAAGAGVAVVGVALFLSLRALFFEGGELAGLGDDALRGAYEDQLARMRDRYDRLSAELLESEQRFDEVVAQIASAGVARGAGGEADAVVQARLQENRQRLRDIAGQRDATLAELEQLRLRALEMERRLAEAQRLADERQASLNDFATTLESTVTERDEANARVRSLSSEVTSLTQRVEDIRTHQAEVMAQLEEATRASMSALEGVLSETGVDVDSLLEEIERTYSGEGGPFVPYMYRPPEAARGFPISEDSVAVLLEKMQRLNAMRIAVERLPLANPLGGETYRFTSGFGPRVHPISGRWTMHNGMDMAAPRGTPVRAPVDGVVTFAGVQRGFGKVVKIRHSLGYETVYAHLHRIRVSQGDQVDRGDHIGDVGSTGRSTGNHLHYEIRRYRNPVNPRPFVEAGRNVFKEQ